MRLFCPLQQLFCVFFETNISLSRDKHIHCMTFQLITFWSEKMLHDFTKSDTTIHRCIHTPTNEEYRSQSDLEPAQTNWNCRDRLIRATVDRGSPPFSSSTESHLRGRFYRSLQSATDLLGSSADTWAGTRRNSSSSEGALSSDWNSPRVFFSHNMPSHTPPLSVCHFNTGGR